MGLADDSADHAHQWAAMGGKVPPAAPSYRAELTTINPVFRSNWHTGWQIFDHLNRPIAFCTSAKTAELIMKALNTHLSRDPKTEELETDHIKRAAAELGAQGGKARAQKMNSQQRVEIARKAAKARWHRP